MKSRNQESEAEEKIKSYYFGTIACTVLSIIILIILGIIVICCFKKKVKKFKVNEISAPKPLLRIEREKVDDREIPDEKNSIPLTQNEKIKITKTYSMKKNKKNLI